MPFTCVSQHLPWLNWLREKAFTLSRTKGTHQPIKDITSVRLHWLPLKCQSLMTTTTVIAQTMLQQCCQRVNHHAECCSFCFGLLGAVVTTSHNPPARRRMRETDIYEHKQWLFQSWFLLSQPQMMPTVKKRTNSGSFLHTPHLTAPSRQHTQQESTKCTKLQN